MGMLEGRDSSRFAFEAHLQIRIRRELRGQDLDSDVAIQPRIARAIHLAHAASADRRHYFVRSEFGATGKGQAAPL